MASEPGVSTSSVSSLPSLSDKVISDRYVLRDYIGQGGFGVVYRADQLFLGEPCRRVAVKILCKQQGIAPEAAKSVFREAFLLAAAMDNMTSADARNHLVHVYDLGFWPEMDGRGYVVMEYVHGTTLARQFDSLQRVPASQLIKWMRQVCVALSGLHTLAEPIIHRDLKPGNVLLGMDLSVRLVDFGLSARLLSNGAVPGVAGTLDYMAPETTLAAGESVPASDVYSVGLMLYRGLTGKLPFEHLIPPLDLPEKAHRSWLYEAKRTCVIAPPSAYNNTVSPDLDTLVLRCLAFGKDRRFRNAKELLDALDEPGSATTGWEATIREVRALHGSRDLVRAGQVLDRSLKNSSHSPEGRFRLLWELGEVLRATEQYRNAAEAYRECWKVVKDTAILKTPGERSRVLKAVACSYRKAGNPFFANKFEKLAEEELCR